jgi:hypothetical protein
VIPFLFRWRRWRTLAYIHTYRNMAYLASICIHIGTHYTHTYKWLCVLMAAKESLRPFAKPQLHQGAVVAHRKPCNYEGKHATKLEAARFLRYPPRFRLLGRSLLHGDRLRGHAENAARHSRQAVDSWEEGRRLSTAPPVAAGRNRNWKRRRGERSADSSKFEGVGFPALWPRFPPGALPDCG